MSPGVQMPGVAGRGWWERSGSEYGVCCGVWPRWLLCVTDARRRVPLSFPRVVCWCEGKARTDIQVGRGLPHVTQKCVCAPPVRLAR